MEVAVRRLSGWRMRRFREAEIVIVGVGGVRSLNSPRTLIVSPNGNKQRTQ